jgi:hypothetical protein
MNQRRFSGACVGGLPKRDAHFVIAVLFIVPFRTLGRASAAHPSIPALEKQHRKSDDSAILVSRIRRDAAC